MTRRETEWRLEDVALMDAYFERADEATSHGVPVSVAYDSDFDPMNTKHPKILSAYSYVDYAEMVIEQGKKIFAAQYGEKSLDHRVFYAQVIPRPKPLL